MEQATKPKENTPYRDRQVKGTLAYKEYRERNNKECREIRRRNKEKTEALAKEVEKLSEENLNLRMQIEILKAFVDDYRILTGFVEEMEKS